MVIPKDIVELIEGQKTPEGFAHEENKLKIGKWFEENTDLFDGTVYVQSIFVTDEISGEEQDDGEYCDQSMFGEDTGSGIYYYQTEQEGIYIACYYSF